VSSAGRARTRSEAPYLKGTRCGGHTREILSATARDIPADPYIEGLPSAVSMHSFGDYIRGNTDPKNRTESENPATRADHTGRAAVKRNSVAFSVGWSCLT